MTVFVYVNTSKQVGDPEQIKVFATADAAATWFEECQNFRDRGSPAEYGAGLKLAIERGWLKMHESGTFVTSRRPARNCSREKKWAVFSKCREPDIG
jgi:hypothetical protein